MSTALFPSLYSPLFAARSPGEIKVTPHRDTSMTPVTHSVTSESIIVSLEGNNERVFSVSVLFTLQSSVLSSFFVVVFLQLVHILLPNLCFSPLRFHRCASCSFSPVHRSCVRYSFKHLALYSLIYSSFPLQPDLQVSSTIVEHVHNLFTTLIHISMGICGCLSVFLFALLLIHSGISVSFAPISHLYLIV